MIGFRHADPRHPFLWEGTDQPAARWHDESDGPVHSFSDTPDGAWAEFLRHEEITDPEDVATIRRDLWAVDLGQPRFAEPDLPRETLTGGYASHPACRAEARRQRRSGVNGLKAPSAALLPGAARGWRVEGGLQPGEPRDGVVYVLFGRRTDLIGWRATADGRPDKELLGVVRHLEGVRSGTRTD